MRGLVVLIPARLLLRIYKIETLSLLVTFREAVVESVVQPRTSSFDCGTTVPMPQFWQDCDFPVLHTRKNTHAILIEIIFLMNYLILMLLWKRTGK